MFNIVCARCYIYMLPFKNGLHSLFIEVPEVKCLFSSSYSLIQSKIISLLFLHWDFFKGKITFDSLQGARRRCGMFLSQNVMQCIISPPACIYLSTPPFPLSFSSMGCCSFSFPSAFVAAVFQQTKAGRWCCLACK